MNITCMVVKFIAGIVGILGLAIIFSCFYLKQPETDAFEIIYILSCALMGLVLVLISYDVIKKFSLRSIQALCSLISLVVVGTLAYCFNNFKLFSEHELIVIILTLVIAILVYEVMIHFIIKRCDFDKKN